MCLSFQNIYALVQCTPDLSKLSYSNCIEGQDDDEIINIESLQFDFATSRVATNNFSDANKLGQGRFGPIYKVINLVNQSNVINFLIC
uniref:G-type lectin S-receptor-like serine/threonine-protein kinase n=1 Tax=Vitis vinifera TaxID=29760 RepID=F6H840_VITVI